MDDENDQDDDLDEPKDEEEENNGRISFTARIDSNTKSDYMDGFVIEKFNGRGQLMVKINDQGATGVFQPLSTCSAGMYFRDLTSGIFLMNFNFKTR
jgi:hypothetical protein